MAQITRGPALASWLARNPSVQFVTPLALFLLFLAVSPSLPLAARWESPLRVLFLGGVCYLCWPRELSARPRDWFASTGIGIGVFFIWIAPDILFPGWRLSTLFSNGIVGHLHSSLPSSELQSPWILFWRTMRAAVIVPIVEELFWRGWLMRWLIDTNFSKVPLGAYTPFAFWTTAILFASEHGPYWDVGLLTGIVYNAWMIRSKSLANCILMHAVTNAILSGYVITTAKWQYWQ